ncbi:MAG: SDR family NAD(P)-dependent oxidoreductase [Bacteroidales bacterium]|mgnify:FL=1|jgi:NAD(P)-dependent dehydrogenase (short-subunit alcohol dehydrogenase family)|nr:SDR family NAD(P)-dependent oxidoreductase [Tissierellia bacterium]NLO43094.1 SDR family NAD(P)-dependent oxidoreductase [Bacteroidales bacterium]
MKKSCLITGANSGIGKQAAIQLAQAGFHVIVEASAYAKDKSNIQTLMDMSLRYIHSIH